MSNMDARQITNKSNSSFLSAFRVLPKNKRKALYAVYAWCRYTDDIADAKKEREEKRDDMLQWHEELEQTFAGNPSLTITENLKHCITTYPINKAYFLEMIEVMQNDINGYHYESWEELIRYCHGVASTVGLMSIEIFGYTKPETKAYAENLGIALQLTNIMRDISKDAHNNRIYVPNELLRKHQVSKRQLEDGPADENWIAMMSEFSEKIRTYYHKAKELLPADDRKKQLPSIIMCRVYFKLFNKIIKRHFEVFGPTIKIGKWKRISIAVHTWLTEKYR